MPLPSSYSRHCRHMLGGHCRSALAGCSAPAVMAATHLENWGSTPSPANVRTFLLPSAICISMLSLREPGSIADGRCTAAPIRQCERTGGCPDSAWAALCHQASTLPWTVTCLNCNVFKAPIPKHLPPSLDSEPTSTCPWQLESCASELGGRGTAGEAMGYTGECCRVK